MNCLDPLKLQAPWEKIKEEQSISPTVREGGMMRWVFEN